MRGRREADYDTMSEDELEEANFCSTLRELQQANPDAAAGISCYEELDAPDGQPIDVESGCLPEAEAESAPENEPDAHDPDDETSELSQIARAKAARLVAAAMADANGGQ